MQKSFILFGLLMASSLITFSGCGGKKTDELKISGNVTVGGQPLITGRISFTPSSAGGVSSSAAVKDGQYNAELLKGDYKVSVTSSKVVGQKKMYDTPDSPMTDIVEETIDPKFNSRTTLTTTITAPKADLDFDVEEVVKRGKK